MDGGGSPRPRHGPAAQQPWRSPRHREPPPRMWRCRTAQDRPPQPRFFTRGGQRTPRPPARLWVGVRGAPSPSRTRHAGCPTGKASALLPHPPHSPALRRLRGMGRVAEAEGWLMAVAAAIPPLPHPPPPLSLGVEGGEAGAAAGHSEALRARGNRRDRSDHHPSPIRRRAPAQDGRRVRYKSPCRLPPARHTTPGLYRPRQ